MNRDDVRYFEHDGLRLAFREEGEGQPILLIHGFASSARVNWVAPGWFDTLTTNGYRVIAIDNRGHGDSQKSRDPQIYYPERMADDASALLDHLGISRAHVMGYSMGARIAAYMALRNPAKVYTAIFGGLGIGMVIGAGEWEPVRDALLAEDITSIKDPRSLMFRKFADNTKSDRWALAACVMTSKKELTENQVSEIKQPVLVAVGEKDDIAGKPEPLVAMMKQAQSLVIPSRDHMLAVGDKVFKRGVVEFLARYPIA